MGEKWGYNVDEWFVVKLDSTNGLRIGIIQDPDGYEVVCGPLSFQEADVKCKEYAEQTGIPVFDNNVDDAIN